MTPPGAPDDPSRTPADAETADDPDQAGIDEIRQGFLQPGAGPAPAGWVAAVLAVIVVVILGFMLVNTLT